MKTKRTYSIVEIEFHEQNDSEKLAASKPLIKSVNVEENVSAEELPSLLTSNDGVKRVVFAGSEIPWEVKQTVQLGEPKTRKKREPKIPTDAVNAARVKRGRRTNAQIAADRLAAAVTRRTGRRRR